MISAQAQKSVQNLSHLGPIVLVGHRGAGKSTLAKAAARQLGRPFFDLDEEIEKSRSPTLSELVSQNLEKFRRIEVEVLANLCRFDEPPIVACGAGIEEIPEEAFVVWIDREDWRDEVRGSNRPRIRPELDVIEEWDWMEATRPERWIEAAHLRLAVPRGRNIERSASDLATLLHWAAAAAHSPVAGKTIMVPITEDDLLRARRDVRRLGLGGVEIRSDVFAEDPPELGDTPYIASLRHDDPTWPARHPDALAWDIDAAFIDSVAATSFASPPDRVIVSLHPPDIDAAHVALLEEAAGKIRASFGIDADRMVLKYSPLLASLRDLRRLVDLLPRLGPESRSVILAPRGSRVAWMRPLFARLNAHTYLPLGLGIRRPDHPSAMDFQQFLPHLAGEFPRIFDALLGSPVAESQGDLWHRRCAIEGGEGDIGYLKIPVASGELDEMLEILKDLPIRGISVTAPLKIEAAQSILVDNREDLQALNTLRRSQDNDRPWLGTDTDVDGMTACLKSLEALGVGPGRAVVFGQGGASHALLRGLKKRGWELVDHVSARLGWQEQHGELEQIDLVVNAAGSGRSRSPNMPPCRALLDLNYTDVDECPPGALHLQGDLFFDAQARTQRRFWSENPRSKKDGPK